MDQKQEQEMRCEQTNVDKNLSLSSKDKQNKQTVPVNTTTFNTYLKDLMVMTGSKV